MHYEEENFENIEAKWIKNQNWLEKINQKNNEVAENLSNESELNNNSIFIQNENLKKLYEIEENIKNKINLDDLLSFHHKINPKNEEIDLSTQKLIEFKERNLNKFKEDILYYCISPEKLLNFSPTKDEEKYYKYCKDLESENFIASQKEIADNILSFLNLDNFDKKKCFDKNIFINMSFVENNDKNREKMANAYLICKKIDKYSLKELKKFDENKILLYFEKIIELFKKNKCDLKSLGITQFNYIENYICLILEIISDKFNKNSGQKIISRFVDGCIELLNYFISSKLLFFIIQFLKEYITILKDINYDYIEKINFIPNNCLDFKEIYKTANIDKLIFIDFPQFFNNEGMYINQEKKFTEHWTLNLGNYLFLFIKTSYKLFNDKNSNKIEINKKQFDISEKEGLFVFKIDLIEKRAIHFKKIDLNTEINENKEKIIDVNISFKDEFIFLIYIIENINLNKYYLKYKIYNNNILNIIKENEIEFDNSFIPLKLLNDYKYIYCFSKSSNVLKIKKDYMFNNRQFINCSIKLYENNTESNISNLDSFKMFNSLSINNLFILDNIISNKKYISTFIKIKNDNYLLKIIEIINSNIINENDDSIIKMTFNDNKFVITKLDLDTNELYFNMTFNEKNNFFDKGILFLTFATNYYCNYEYSNIYEYILQKYSFILNLFGNYDMLKGVKEENLLKLPLSLICNLSENNLKTIIKNIIEDNEYNNIKLYYLVILKQIICFLYNTDDLNEEKIKDIIPYLKNLIVNIAKEKKKKIYYKIIKEIIIISSYLKNYKIVEYNDIKFIFEENKEGINDTIKLLIIELLLEQKQTQKDIELYKIIINLENNNIKYLRNLDIVNNDNLEDLSYYSLSKKLMLKSSEKLFEIYNSEYYDDLIDIIPFLTKNIQEIGELYINLLENKNSNILLDIYSFIYNSFTFRFFYFIIEKFIVNKKFINNEYILDIYKTILILDKIEINDIFYDLYDMNNVIEIKNSLLKDTDSQGYYNINYNRNKIPIKLKEPKSLIIKTSFSSCNNLNKLIYIKLIKKNNESYIVNLNYEDGYMFKNVKKIEVELLNNDNDNNNDIISLKDFVINIIPIKNEDEYYMKKNNNDNKILLLIQKSIIYYLLFLFEDIHSQIDKFNSNEIINKHCKLYQTEIFKFISIPENKEKLPLEKNIEDNPVIKISNDFINKMGEILGKNNTNFDSLNKYLMTKFGKINEELDKNYKKIYEKEIKEINRIIKETKGNKIISIKNINNYDDLFIAFKNKLFKNNPNIQTKSQTDNLIKKIFFIAIKYYNCFDKLDILLEEMNEIPKDKEFNIKVQSLQNFNLFYPIYEESFKIRSIYNNDKNKLNDEEFEKENMHYLEKLEFLDTIIVPSDENEVKPNITIVKKVLNLVGNKDIKLFEIEKYSQIQNISCQIKIIELLIISNLLYSLKGESNIVFLLYLICRKMHETQDKDNSFFDKIHGADYYIIETLKYQFHLLLSLISDKIISNKNNYSTITKISLTESLMWKIRGRNFPALNKIINIFEEIKTFNKYCDDNQLFTFEYSNIYNVNYYNEKKKNDIIFDIFKILVNQIINKIKYIIESKEEKNTLILIRNPSNIKKEDYKDILKVILSFFINLSGENEYYNQIILFFYKILVNSPIFINYILSNYKDVICKILKISLGNEDQSNKELYKNKILSKLIMMKLLCQILENIDDIDKYENIMDCCNIFKKENINFYKKNSEDEYNEINIIIDENESKNNPFIYLFEGIFDKIKNNNGNKIINKYYHKLLLICINKILENKYLDEKDINSNLINNLIKNNLSNIILLLFNKENSGIIENNYINKSLYNQIFEEEALLSSEEDKSIKSGKIICFLNDKSAKSFSNYLTDKTIIHFEPKMFDFLIENPNDEHGKAFVITNEILETKPFNISNMETKSIQDLTILINDSDLQNSSIKTFFRLIINILLKEINNNSLNEKGIYFIFKIISKVVNYINKEEANIFLKFIWKYYNENKNEEYNYPFMSFEFIENIIENNLNFYFKNHENIYKQKEINYDNKFLPYLFNYIIKDNSLGIYLKSNNIIVWYKECLISPIINKNKDKIIEKIYNNIYELSNISFYKSHEIFNDEVINDNSILFTESIRYINDIMSLTEIIEKNNSKIKIIIIKNFNNDNEFNNDLTKFINKYNIPIYIIENNLYDIIINFFIEGKGELYSYNITNDKNDLEDENIIDYYKFVLDVIEKNENCENSTNIVNDNQDDINKEKEKNSDNILSNKEIKKEKMIEFEINRNKIYDELINKQKKFYQISSIKLAKRLIYDILSLEFIKLSEMKDIFKDIKTIVNIF